MSTVQLSAQNISAKKIEQKNPFEFPQIKLKTN